MVVRIGCCIGAAGFIAPLSAVAPEGAVEELSRILIALSDVTYNDYVYGLVISTIASITTSRSSRITGSPFPPLREEVTAAEQPGRRHG